MAETDRKHDLPYRERVEVYDLIHARKPYEAEARYLRRLIRQFGPRGARNLLDVACGTGRHLEQFVRWFDCVGLDRSPAMLAVARARVPGARWVNAPMESFELDDRFDVITCLFSAIGYVRSRRDLFRTVATWARHLRPGGVALVEPWFTPRVFRAGRVDVVRAEREGLTVVRMNSTSRMGTRSRMDFHYLIGSRGRVAYVRELHDCGLFDRSTMLAAFRAAGLQPTYRAEGPFAGRGLYVGVKRTGTRR